MNDDGDDRIGDPDFDRARRATLKRLAQVAWTVPVVTTFPLGGLKMSSVWAQGANGITHS
jgi:hypothetical protein